jgi:gamma-glutamylcyclotransferase (GGCT)/AIG2-like uncharacterized protein YtfP
MAPGVVTDAAPGAKPRGAACLPDYRLAFTRRSIRTGTGVADIVPAGGRSVWGALYDIPEDEFANLDRKEGGGWAYQRTPVRVRPRGASAAQEAVAYTVVARDADHVPPSDDYLAGMIAAARTLGLPNAYLEELEAIRQRRR